jgi:hypothetical protein
MKRMALRGDILALYQGEISITATVAVPEEAKPLDMQLMLPACDERVCLPPGSVSLREITGKIQ